MYFVFHSSARGSSGLMVTMTNIWKVLGLNPYWILKIFCGYISHSLGTISLFRYAYFQNKRAIYVSASLSIKSSLGVNGPEVATQNPWCSYTVPAQTLMNVGGYQSQNGHLCLIQFSQLECTLFPKQQPTDLLPPMDS